MGSGGVQPEKLGNTQENGKHLSDLRISTNYSTKPGFRSKQQTGEVKQDLPFLNYAVTKNNFKSFHRRGTNTMGNSGHQTGVLNSKDYNP